jgi:hypothetical protein
MMKARLQLRKKDGTTWVVDAEHPNLEEATTFQIDGKWYAFTGQHNSGMWICVEAIQVNLDVAPGDWERF